MSVPVEPGDRVFVLSLQQFGTVRHTEDHSLGQIVGVKLDRGSLVSFARDDLDLVGRGAVLLATDGGRRVS